MEAPKIETTEKGFLVIPINLQQNLHVKGMCICDSCNSASFDTMYYLPVLAGRTYCKECYDEWHQDATYYKEDTGYEKSNAQSFLKQFNKAVQ